MRGIELKGQYFSELTKIDLFSDVRKNEQTKSDEEIETNFAILYGKNGSGKTTISSALYEYKSGLKNFEVVQPYRFNGELIDIEKGSIYVFNDLFTSENVSFKSDDALNAIVLLGESGDIEEKIKGLEASVESENKKISSINIDKYTDKKSSLNVDEAREKIASELRNHWAIREQKIRGLVNKAQVKPDILQLIINGKKPSKTQKELSSDFDKLIDDIESTNENATTLPNLTITVDIKNTSFYNELLTRNFDKKAMTDFANSVFVSLHDNSSKFLDVTKDMLENNDICPVCFQSVNSDYKQLLRETIDIIFDDKIEKEKEELRKEIIKPIDKPDLLIYSKHIDPNHIKELADAIDSLNATILTINESLESKMGSIYTAREPISNDVDEIKERFDISLKTLNADISAYNLKVEHREESIKEAKKVNLELAYYDCASQINSYNKILSDYEKDKREINNCLKQIEDYREEITKLNLKRKNVGIALDEINGCMRYIFGSKERLYLKPNESGDKYFIVSNGKNIKAKKLSTGERNIISLVYFYELMKENKGKDSYFRDKCLVIIDDPISSFDYENKMGILSFLKRIIIEITEGNSESQIAIFTHEIEIANFIHRIFDDLKLSKKVSVKMLKNKKTEKMNDVKYSNYGALMIDVFEYAKNEDHTKDIYIGNTIRRMLEAYSSFNYSESIDKFLAKKDYANKITDKEIRDYLFSRMNRLFMNEGSHSETIIRQVPDSLDFDLFDADEKVKIARETLLILYCIDNNHVLRYLGEETKKIFESWIDSLRSEVIE